MTSGVSSTAKGRLIFVNLPFVKRDHLTLQRKLDEIGDLDQKLPA